MFILFLGVNDHQLSTDIIPFDVRLCLVDRCQLDTSQRVRSFDIHHYRRKLAVPIDECTSSLFIDELLSTINELKSNVDYYITIEHMTVLIDCLIVYLLTGHKQLMEHTYDFILKFIDKYPQHASVFYSAYVQCLLSNNTLVFQMAIDHFSLLIIYFQAKSHELFYVIIKQGLINKIDVTTSITQGIRLLNLHRYDPMTYTNVTSTMTLATPSLITTVTPAAIATTSTIMVND
jgi:hypothetical protein